MIDISSHRYLAILALILTSGLVVGVALALPPEVPAGLPQHAQ